MTKAQRLQLVRAIIIFLGVIFVGTAGYMIIEGYSLLQALFMTVITLSTVGYGEPKPLDNAGQIFTIIIILCNLGIVGYTITLITSIFIQTDFVNYYRTKNMNKKISEMNNHVIVCGFGRTGREACATLTRNHIPFVIVEKHAAIITELKGIEGQMFVDMDATTNEALIAAGIKNAKALITTLPEDADNVFVTLTASELNPKLLIVSRATHSTSIPKLKRAGAANVIMPYKIGGAHMASLVINPDIKEFIDLIAGYGEFHPHIEEINLFDKGDKFAGKTLKEIDLHGKTGVNIIGLKTDEKYTINPDDQTIYNTGDKLIILGSPAQFEKLKQLTEV